MIKAKDIAWCRFSAPDLDLMEKFLLDFGLVRSARTETALYMRAASSDHHIHVTHLGDPAFLGLAFKAESEADLEKVAAADGASAIEEIKEPGGGKRVCLTDPDGNKVEIVHGVEELAPLEVKNRYDRNFGGQRRRVNELLRLERGPAQCLRLGHAVLYVSDSAASREFYSNHLGLVDSDLIYKEGEETPAFSFMRLDRGEEFVDHHTLLTVPREEPGFNHMAFEVHDENAIFLGHEHLAENGYEHSWGVGRHILGSQIFDYWFDPFGFRVEHWADGDLLNNKSPTGKFPVETVRDSQWGVSAADRK